MAFLYFVCLWWAAKAGISKALVNNARQNWQARQDDLRIKDVTYIHRTNTDLDVKMIMQVHYELIFEVAAKDLEKAQTKIVGIMQNSSQIDVPLLEEAGVGYNWNEAH